MSKSISVIFILLIIIIAGFAYFNYNQLNQIQSDLLKKEALLEKSEKLIKEQDASLALMEEKIKEVLEKEELSSEELPPEKLPPEEPAISAGEDKLQKQLEGYQEELQTLQLKIEEVLQKNKTDSENIAFLREEKSKLEALLSEREVQWLEKEEESKNIIASLQKGIEQYEAEIELINNKVLSIEQYLESEQLQRVKLEQDMVKYEETIGHLREQLALKQDNEAYAQKIGQIESNKKELKEEISQKDSLLLQFQEEYQKLQNQLTGYEQKIVELQEETAQVLGQKEILAEIKNNLAQLEEEKSKMELILQEKETQWLEKEKIDKDTIVLLQEEIKKYELNIKEIGKEILVLQEDLIKERTSMEQEPKYYEVKRGDCLWTIARNRYNEGIAWAKIFRANEAFIKNPDLIYPYQQFILPD